MGRHRDTGAEIGTPCTHHVDDSVQVGEIRRCLGIGLDALTDTGGLVVREQARVQVGEKVGGEKIAVVHGHVTASSVAMTDRTPAAGPRFPSLVQVLHSDGGEDDGELLTAPGAAALDRADGNAERRGGIGDGVPLHVDGDDRGALIGRE